MTGTARRDFVPKEWHQYWSERLMGAACKKRPDLPWTGHGDNDGKELDPSPAEIDAMHDVCLSCPVLLGCADYALDRQLPAHGGMYASIWIPWRPANGATEPSKRTKGWIEAREKIRRLRRVVTEQTIEALYAMPPSFARPRRSRSLRSSSGGRA